MKRWTDEWLTGWENDGHGAKTETYPLIGGYESVAGSRRSLSPGHLLVDLFGGFGGGYIGGTSHSIMPETPLDNVIAMYEALLEYQR